MSINQSTNSSDASLPPEASPKGVATADGSPPLPIHALPSCPLQPISPHSPLPHILLHPIFPSSKGSSPPIRTLSTTQIHLLNKFFISHPFNMAKSSQGAPFHPFHHTTPHPTSMLSHATPLIHPHYSLYPTLTHHMPPHFHSLMPQLSYTLTPHAPLK